MISLERGFKDARVFRRFGNVTTLATTDVLVAARAYNEQSSQAQRSVKSTSIQDNSTGTGAKKIRLTYLNSNYVVATEDVVLDGQTAVNTVATDMRFVESFDVIEGAAAAGAIELWSGTGGAGTAICGIGTATTQAFLCHHYVPAGKQAWVLEWGSTITREGNLKLLGQARADGVNLVDVALDLENIKNNLLANESTSSFDRALAAVLVPEKTRIRAHVVQGSASSMATRAWFYYWEE